MAKLTRREIDERKQAVLNYFLAHPRATGDEAQRALTAGKLTGNKGPPMGFGMLFRLKREAEAQLRSGRVPTVAAPLAQERSENLNGLRDAAAEIQELLAKLPNIAEVRVSRASVTVVRTVTQEETL